MSTRNRTFLERYRRLAIQSEAYRTRPYDDKTGKAPVLATGGKITIGIGHNLTDLGLSARVIDMIFEEDFTTALLDLQTFPWWGGLDDVRQLAIMDLRFNLGPSRFRLFSITLGYVADGNFIGAARAFRANRKYFAQTGRRAERIAHMLETGRETS